MVSEPSESSHNTTTTHSSVKESDHSIPATVNSNATPNVVGLWRELQITTLISDTKFKWISTSLLQFYLRK